MNGRNTANRKGIAVVKSSKHLKLLFKLGFLVYYDEQELISEFLRKKFSP